MQRPRKFRGLCISLDPQANRTYLRILLNRFVSIGTRRKETRAGVKLVDIADKNFKTVLTTYLLKFDIPVSFLISPDIYRIGK